MEQGVRQADPGHIELIERPIDRRRFLRLAAAAGASAVGAGIVVGPQSTMAQSAVPGPAVGARDPIGDLAAALDYDVERIHRFVADEIRYEPYAGALRGARGTLDARAGNSLDQALLMGALLDASMVGHRLVTATLDDASAEAILASSAADLATAKAHAARVLVEDAQAAGIEAAAPSAEAEAFAASMEADADRVVAVAAGQLDDTVATITAALASLGVALPRSSPVLPELERGRHAWVQVQNGAEWLDLDPTLPGAAPGDRAVDALEVLDALPDDLRHRVEIVATVEYVAGGELRSEPVIEYAGFSDELHGVPVSFSNMKPDGFGAMGLTIRNVLGDGGVQYNSLLGVGSSMFVGDRPIRLNVGGGTDLFGEAQPSPAGVGEEETTAQWLEVRVTSPGRATAVSRRTIFDRIGDAARAGGTVDLAAVAPVVLVDLGEEEKQEYPPLSTAHAFSVATGAVNGRSLVAGPTSTDDPGLMSAVARTYHFLRDGLAADLALSRGVRPFMDMPNVTSWVLRVEGTSAADVSSRLGFDVWHRGTGWLPLDDREASVPPALLAGVLSHVAERMATRDGLGEPLDSALEAVSVGAVFEAATSAGVPIRTLRGSLPADLSFDPEVAQRLAAVLGAGDVVIVPEQPVALAGRPHLGWWRVDPATGAAIDEMDDGSGASMTEYALKVWRVVKTAACWAALGEKILAAIAIVAKLLEARDGIVGGIALGAIGLWGANFFNPGWATACRAAAAGP